ncbi:MAG: hypothetical protein JWR02_1771 [Mucilaginibacter sp.]|nr:hypothetical protein [Mucilaginibacter sp.]
MSGVYYFSYDLVMKRYILSLYAGFALILSVTACSDSVKTKLKGSWRSKDGLTRLNITEKGFIMDDEAFAEEYFLKGDTIFTSFQGNQPYTSFIVQKLDDHYLKLLGPDSVAIEYGR